MRSTNLLTYLLKLAYSLQKVVAIQGSPANNYTHIHTVHTKSCTEDSGDRRIKDKRFDLQRLSGVGIGIGRSEYGAESVQSATERHVTGNGSTCFCTGHARSARIVIALGADCDF